MAEALIVHDPDVPALAALLGAEGSSLVADIVGATGGELRSCRPAQVRYRPGKSVTVQYFADVVRGGGAARRETVVASSGVRVPEGTALFSDGGIEVAAWRFPDDPFLPGLAPAVDPARAAEVLEQLGVPAGDVTVRTRAYRPGRRAVVEVTSEAARIYLKVLRPSKVAGLQARHRALADHVPVPVSLGWSADLGIVALQALPGRPLRKSLEAVSRRLPPASSLIELLDRFPEPEEDAVPVAAAYQRAAEHAVLLRAVLPNASSRIDAVVAAMEEVAAEAPIAVHGDFHSSQVLVDGSAITGLVDVDTAGIGSRADDLAGMLGHLGTVSITSQAKRHIDRYGAALIKEFDRVADPRALRLRVAAVIFGLATGPFRVQTPRWRRETDERIALAERWIRSAAAAH